MPKRKSTCATPRARRLDAIGASDDHVNVDRSRTSQEERTEPSSPDNCRLARG